MVAGSSNSFRIRRRRRPEETPKVDEVALGIAVCGALTEQGQTRALHEIAAFAGCTTQAISKIEQKAMRKLREGLADYTYRTFLDEL